MNLPFSMFVLSDLHLEFCNKPIDKYVKRMPKKDILILAGDIGLPNKKHFSRFLFLSSKKYEIVIFVPGNHEYYSEYDDDKIEEICVKYGVIFLQNDFIIHEDVVFIGSTLWTELNGISISELNNMNDFHRIPWMNKNIWNQKHKTALNFITKTLDEYSDKRCIVITHHTPSFHCIPNQFKYDNLNICYFTDLEYLFKKKNLKCWISGHTHKKLCKYYEDNDTILFSNPGREPNTYNLTFWHYCQDEIWNAYDEV